MPFQWVSFIDEVALLYQEIRKQQLHHVRVKDSLSIQPNRSFFSTWIGYQVGIQSKDIITEAWIIFELTRVE